jgi:hypothetical protein
MGEWSDLFYLVLTMSRMAELNDPEVKAFMDKFQAKLGPLMGMMGGMGGMGGMGAGMGGMGGMPDFGDIAEEDEGEDAANVEEVD